MREYLLEARKSLNMSQEKVANEIGISRTHYTQIENGTRNPSVDIAKKLGVFFELEWTIFFN